MRKNSGWGIRLTIGLLLVLALMLTACDEVPTSTPAPIATEGQVVLNLPTRTLPPIVSETPRFTATPIPSITYTPSVTPTPTLTAVPPTITNTPTPTLTPTVSGEVRSTENVNLREGPGTDYDIVASVPSGTQIGVLGIQTDEQGRDWYKVAYTDEDGETANVWVFAALVDTDFKTVVGLVTPVPGTEATPRPNATSEPERVEILAYCAQKGVAPPRPTTNDNVFIEWSWFVSQADLMEQHLDNATYEVTLDGEPLDDWDRYDTEMILEAGVWIIYWYYPVGKLDPGIHEVTYRVTWDEAITDGYDEFGPGTANETDTGNCTFTVIDG